VKRILFVDDEVAVLDGLKNRLRKYRHEWEMVFATSGQAALDECDRTAFDVVVSDMRMPGMDGAALLREIKSAYPQTVRIVLSGHAERQAVMRAIPVAHQYLSKPCDSDALRAVISRTCALQKLLGDDRLRAIVGRVEKLPSVSTIYLDLTDVLAREQSSVDDIVRVVERDPAMCLKLLQVVNSAFFGLARRVTAMNDAIGYLGVDLLKSLVLVSQIFAAADGPDGLEGGSLTSIQQHSMLVARVARKIIPTCTEDAFMAGMLHDVGEIVLALADRERAKAFAVEARERRVPVFTVERERLAITHAEVGAYILGTWGVPFAIVEAVASHHEPRRLPSTSFDAMAAVHIAEGLVTEEEGNGPPRAALLDEQYLAGLGLMGRLPEWLDLVKQMRKDAQA
jgi:HD-like signal output (HDOD) protein